MAYRSHSCALQPQGPKHAGWPRDGPSEASGRPVRVLVHPSDTKPLRHYATGLDPLCCAKDGGGRREVPVLRNLETAPPMPPPPLLQSLPEPPLISACGRMVGPARTTRTAWQRAAPPAWSAKIGTTRQAQAATLQDNMHACADMQCQSKQGNVHRLDCLCRLLASSRPM